MGSPKRVMGSSERVGGSPEGVIGSSERVGGSPEGVIDGDNRHFDPQKPPMWVE